MFTHGSSDFSEEGQTEEHLIDSFTKIKEQTLQDKELGNYRSKQHWDRLLIFSIKQQNFI